MVLPIWSSYKFIIVYLYIVVLVEVLHGKYMGCYMELPGDSRRLLHEDHKIFNYTSPPSLCLDYCRNKGYLYAGIKYNTECFCGNTRPSYMHSTSERTCKFLCPSDVTFTETCFKPNRISLYEVFEVQKNPVQENYVGCVVAVDKKNPWNIEMITPEKCVAVCFLTGFRFAAIINKECFCQDCFCQGSNCSNHVCPSYCENDRCDNEINFIKNISVNDNLCNIKCEGNNKFNCGGQSKFSVYKTGITGYMEKSYALGCFLDNDGKLISDFRYNHDWVNFETGTARLCFNTCRAFGFKYAGVRTEYNCHCGNAKPHGKFLAPKTCDAISNSSRKMTTLYFTRDFKNESKGKYVGCYKEVSSLARLLNGDHLILRMTNSPGYCILQCQKKGFTYAGLENSYECFCASYRPSYIYATAEHECNLPCEGDRTEICGASNRISVYQISEIDSNPIIQNYIGCLEISQSKFQMLEYTFIKGLTPEKCVAACYRNGFRFAALQHKQCFCGDADSEEFIQNSICQINCVSGYCGYLDVRSISLEESECNTKCENSTLNCGGPSRSSVYNTGIVGLSQIGRSLGCYQDDSGTILSGYHVKLERKNSPILCSNICYGIGFIYAGVRAGFDCFCGNVIADDKILRPEFECASSCPGEPTKHCGGNSRTYIYAVQGSSSEIINKKPCKNNLLFEENFSGVISSTIWRHEVKMPWLPDYEFVILNNKAENVFTRNGKLFIKPVLLEDDFVQTGKINLNDCTGIPYTEECVRQAIGFQILPPIESGKITTQESFSFKYGKIQVGAKLPRGDWIVPEIWLEPKRNIYGPHLASGRIRIAMARGNKDLTINGEFIGSRLLEFGITMGIDGNIRSRTISTLSTVNQEWYNDFHNYTLHWAPDNLSFYVDSELVGSLIEPGKTLSNMVGFDKNISARWKFGSSIAPFDQEFYISLGVSVGGMREFPDSCVSGSNPKPWRNMAVKAMLDFWKDRNVWHNTWQGDHSALQIDHILVTTN